jgi:hypothetical protein
MKEQFIEKAFKQKALDTIVTINRILDNYGRQGYRLTLRQLYYQMVARALIENTQQSYKRIGNIVNDGRLAGMIDWDAIEDRTRALKSLSHWDNPKEIMYGAANSFRLDKWENQKYRIEVWVEKDALVGVLERVCNRLDVPYFSCRGYGSQSEMYEAAKRLSRYVHGEGKKVAILHLGDHDPSGIDMTRDIRDRLQMFMGKSCPVERLALNWEQIELYDPPPNFAKESDSRFTGYQEKFGDESWELDSLEPRVIDNLIETNVLRYRDEDRWREMVEREKLERAQLNQIADNFDTIVEDYNYGIRGRDEEE